MDRPETPVRLRRVSQEMQRLSPDHGHFTQEPSNIQGSSQQTREWCAGDTQCPGVNGQDLGTNTWLRTCI